MQHRHLRAFFRGLPQPLRHQRVILAQEAAHDEHAIELVHVGDRQAEPWHALRVAVASEIALAQAEVDVVAAQPAHQATGERHFLQRRVRRDERAQRAGAVLGHDVGQPLRDEFERDLPVDGFPFAALLDHRRRQPLARIEALVREAILVGDPAFVDGFVLERQHAQHAVAHDLDDQVAAQRIVRRHRFAARKFPRARRVAKRLRRQRADRAHVDRIARQLGVDRLADERDDLRVLAAADHPELHDAGDFLAEANAARALDAARHLLGRDERAQVLVEDDPLGLGVARCGTAVTHGQVLQLAFAALVADRAIERMVDQQELHHALLRRHRLLGIRPDLHAFGRGRCAGRQRLGRLLDLDQAHPAIGGDRQLLVITEMRHIDAERMRGFDQRRAVRDLQRLAVDLDVQQRARVRHTSGPGSACDRCDTGIRRGNS